MYIDQSYFVWFCCLLNIFCSGTTKCKTSTIQQAMEKMVEPPPSEGGEATITAMSALAAVGQYLSTNSAKSTFLRNTGLVVKAISSKLPHDQDMQAQSNVVFAL